MICKKLNLIIKFYWIMLYFKFKDSKWIRAESKGFAYMVYWLSYYSSLGKSAGFTKKETKTALQLFSK